jgi:Nucleotidyltransferase domain
VTALRWRYPDVGMEPAHIRYAGEFVEGLPYRDRMVAAVVTGSRAAGLAHARSDLDLIVVVPADEDRNRCRTYPARHGGMVIDTEVITVNDLSRHIARQRARESAATLDRGSYALPDLWGWSNLVRLVIGHVVTATPQGQGLLAALNRDALRRALMVHAVLCLATFVEDAQGSVECGDLATALTTSEEVARYGFEVALAGLDDLYLGRKYLLRRIARHESLTATFDQVEELLGQPAASSSDGDIVRLVRRRLLLASHLVGHSLTTAWREPAPALPPFRPQDRGPIRDPHLVPVRWPGGMGLMTGVDVVRTMPAEAAALWNLLDGRPVDDVATEFARRTGHDASSADAYVRRSVGEWCRDGLVREPAREDRHRSSG